MNSLVPPDFFGRMYQNPVYDDMDTDFSDYLPEDMYKEKTYVVAPRPRFDVEAIKGYSEIMDGTNRRPERIVYGYPSGCNTGCPKSQKELEDSIETLKKEHKELKDSIEALGGGGPITPSGVTKEEFEAFKEECYKRFKKVETDVDDLWKTVFPAEAEVELPAGGVEEEKAAETTYKRYLG